MSFLRTRLARLLSLINGGDEPLLRVSYAQTGEDIIVDYIFQELGIARPSYLDIGAHHPTFLSNTYFFYQRGAQGVLVEPDPALAPAFRVSRPMDTLLGVGVGPQSGEADFYVMSEPTLNTFSKEEAERNQRGGKAGIERVLPLRVVGINELLEQYGCPNLVSLDIEGLDAELLNAWNFERFRPEVVIVETATYTHVRGGERKRPEIFERMKAAEYFTYGDTYINSIFVDWRIWDLR